MKSICFFNNKGGVGKTTLICNVASYVATELDRRVAVVDADPQCNSTQLVMLDEDLERLYTTRKRRGRSGRTATTLLDILRPIAAGESDISDKIRPYPCRNNHFGVDLVPCHPRVSLLEDKLSRSWLDFSGKEMSGLRITNWNTQLLQELEANYDVVFYDVGPSLGALNRSVLVGVDYFLTPMSCDIYSIMGISNIAEWLTEWMKVYEDSCEECIVKWDLDPSDYAIQTDTTDFCRFVGYTVQQYITKSKEGIRRATTSYENILRKIPRTINKHLKSFLAPHLRDKTPRLPDVPFMFSLVPMSQRAHKPIHRAEGKDGLAGAQFSQKEKYVEFIQGISQSLLKNLEVCDGESD